MAESLNKGEGRRVKRLVRSLMKDPLYSGWTIGGACLWWTHGILSLVQLYRGKFAIPGFNWKPGGSYEVLQLPRYEVQEVGNSRLNASLSQEWSMRNQPRGGVSRANLDEPQFNPLSHLFSWTWWSRVGHRPWLQPKISLISFILLRCASQVLGTRGH